jgi:chaperonin cofactor prefoldin
MNNILDYWKEISIAIGSLVSFLAGRKSNVLLEKKQEIDTVDSMRTMYNNFIADYNVQYDNLTKRLNALEVRNAVLTESAETWETKFKVLKKQHDALQLAFNKLKNQI